jgi:hypothetical protein
LRLLRAATLLAPDVDATARRYQDFFGYTLAESGAVPPALAQAWAAPAMADRRYHVLAPASGTPVFLRFIQAEPPPAYEPLRTYGWAAIELCVKNVQATHERLKNSPFSIIGPPKALDGAPAIWPMQVQGPDGEIIFLTEIRADEPHARLPRAKSAIDELFIAVHACADLTATRAWFETALALTGAENFELAYTTLSRAFDLPTTQKHKIAVLAHGTDAFLQLDQYPPTATPRPANPGELPPGIAIVSLLTPPPAAKLLNPPGILYAGAPCHTLHTPDGAILEFITMT